MRSCKGEMYTSQKIVIHVVGSLTRRLGFASLSLAMVGTATIHNCSSSCLLRACICLNHIACDACMSSSEPARYAEPQLIGILRSLYDADESVGSDNNKVETSSRQVSLFLTSLHSDAAPSHSHPSTASKAG